MELLLTKNAKDAVTDIYSEHQALIPAVFSNEVVPLEVAILERIKNSLTPRIWEPIDLTGWTIRAGIGRITDPPSSGYFTLTYGSDTTGLLAHNASANDVQTALNALGDVGASGGVTVSATGSSYYTVTFNTFGSKSLIDIDAELIQPDSLSTVGRLVIGSDDKHEVQYIRITAAPAAYAEFSEDSDEPVITVTELVAGSASGSHKILVDITPTPYDGSWTLSILDKQTGLIPSTATADEVLSAIEATSTVGTGNVSVSKESESRWSISFQGDLISTGLGTITATNLNLRAIQYKTGELDLRTTAIDQLLGSSEEIQAIFEVEGVPPTGKPMKLFRGDITLIKSLIDTSATVPTPRSSYYTQAQVDAIVEATKLALQGNQLFLPYDDGSTRLMINDSFDRANSLAGGVGNGWLDALNVWSINSNEIQSSSSSYSTAFLRRQEKYTQPRVKAVVEYKATGGLGASAAIWVSTDPSASNGYAVWLTESSGQGRFAIGKFTGGVPTFSEAIVTLVVGQYYQLTIQRVGNQIIGSVATEAAPDVILAELTLNDSSYQSGHVAITPLVASGKVKWCTVEELATGPLAILDGNSLMAGYNVAYLDSIRAKLQVELGAGWTILNKAVSGQTTLSMLSDAVTQIDSLYTPSRYRSVVIFFEVINHIFYGATAPLALAAAKSYGAGRKAAGHKVLMLTPTPRNELGTPANQEADRLAVAAGMRVESMIGVYWDGIYDVGADSRLQDVNNLTYYSDKVHGTSAMYDIWADGLAAAEFGKINP